MNSAIDHRRQAPTPAGWPMRSGFWRWMRPAGELRAPGMPMAWPRSRRALVAHLEHIRRSSGPTATVSCCPTVTARMLLYALLHLTGYHLRSSTRSFRNSLAHPGPPRWRHPAWRHHGPLARDSRTRSNGTAERLLATRFNRDGFPVVDHLTWTFVGDGCLMEGSPTVARSPARSALPSRRPTTTTDLDRRRRAQLVHRRHVARFAAYGWNVIADIDGHDVWAPIARSDREGLGTQRARRSLRADADPVPHVIGKGRRTGPGPRRPRRAAGPEEIRLTPRPWRERRRLRALQIPTTSCPGTRAARARRRAVVDHVRALRSASGRGREFERRMQGELPATGRPRRADIEAGGGWRKDRHPQGLAERAEHLGPALPELIGGSADLTGSNLTDFKGCGALRVADQTLGRPSRELRRARVRHERDHERLALHGGFIPTAAPSSRSRTMRATRCAWRADAPAGGVRAHARLDRPGETAHAPAGGARRTLRLIPQMDVWRRPIPSSRRSPGLRAGAPRRTDLAALSRQAVPFVTRSEGQSPRSPARLRAARRPPRRAR